MRRPYSGTLLKGVRLVKKKEEERRVEDDSGEPPKCDGLTVAHKDVSGEPPKCDAAYSGTQMTSGRAA
jgi:hypothetical protein